MYIILVPYYLIEHDRKWMEELKSSPFARDNPVIIHYNIFHSYKYYWVINLDISKKKYQAETALKMRLFKFFYCRLTFLKD